MKADPHDYYSQEEIARSKAYQEPLSRARLIARAVKGSTLILVISFHAAPRMVHGLGIEAWPVQLTVIIVAYNLVSDLLTLPINIWIQFRHDRDWGFSTTTRRTFVVDLIKGYGIFLPLLIGVAIGLWAIIRATDLWWFYGALALTLVFLVLQVAGPLLIGVFNKLTPLEDPDLVQRIKALADAVSARVAAVFVIDASKRSRKDNAAFTGLGKTKRVIIFDNMLELPPENVEVVVAHEFGHWRRRTPIRDFVLDSFVEGPVTLGAIALIVSWHPLLRWAGVTGIREPAALPLVLFSAGVTIMTTSWWAAWRSRWQERVADFDSLDLTQDPNAYRDLWRRMPERNLPDLDPSWWKRLSASHPPAHQRIAFADIWEQRRLP